MTDKAELDLVAAGMVNPVRFRRMTPTRTQVDRERMLQVIVLLDTRRLAFRDFIPTKHPFRAHHPCIHCGKDLCGETGYRALESWRLKWRICRECFTTMMKKAE